MKLHDCQGDWALVTGASSGIGREFAVQLAAAGMNVVLVARRQERLAALAAELSRRQRVRALSVPLDLSRPHSAVELTGRLEAADVRIRLLCNNAGFGPWGPVDWTSADTSAAVVQLVAVTPLALCRLLLPVLSSFPSSAIINVSSPAALQPVPYMATYAAAKACLHQFSLALYGELQGRGVRVQTLMPGPTASEFDAQGGAYRCALTEERRPPAEVVATSLAHLERDAPLVTTHRGTYKQRVFAGLFPIRTVIRTVARMFQPPADVRLARLSVAAQSS